MSPLDPEGAAAHLRNGLQILGLLESGTAAVRPTDDGRYTPENEGRDAAEALEAVVSRCCRAISAHLATMNARPHFVSFGDQVILEQLERAHREAVYCLKTWLTIRCHDGGPKLTFALSNYATLTRRIREALREVEA